ncbi:protein of unknown function [Methylocaldum szegediense]|uniref:Uncharacterized protein n=1 Tax=Methylocaldum szegediense TaxID=73780 RepID=A0ABM9I383_9GAMM|nr:protein of unknown function [Methylocaldum szegediense]
MRGKIHENGGTKPAIAPVKNRQMQSDASAAGEIAQNNGLRLCLNKQNIHADCGSMLTASQTPKLGCQNLGSTYDAPEHGHRHRSKACSVYRGAVLFFGLIN